MKKFTKNLLLLSGILLLAIPEAANALPNFARQTGKSCVACHAQNMPKLNAYGRHFVLSGYTIYDDQGETQSLVEGGDVPLGLPSVLNASVVLNARYIKTSQNLDANSTDVVGTQRGELQVLEGSGLYFGGRISDNVGGLVSLTGDPSDEYDVVFNGKAILSYEELNGYAGVSLYSTQTNGIFSGMENFNTGLNSPIRQFENANTTNAAQATGIGRGPATGVQAYYGDKNIFATIGLTIPSQNNEGIDAGDSLMPFGRITYNNTLGDDWNIMFGAYVFSGYVTASDDSFNATKIDASSKLVTISKEGYGIDLEASGSIADMMTMTTINIVMKNIVDVNPDIALESPSLQQTDNKASSIEFQINPITPLGIKVAYLNYVNNDDTATGKIGFVNPHDFNAYSLGLNYLLRQNILVNIEYGYVEPILNTMDSYSDFYISTALSF
ncbi:MAG: hypothetical protein ABFQ64_06835 [Campylobacterota bacterium]